MWSMQELQAQLQGLCTTGKRSSQELRQAKQDTFKKVINYMTLGMDMSGLFPMMTSCANLSPDDIVLKKMLYLYITHYAASTPDLVLLTINQLHKDCQDQDPTVRGLALRSLCSLRITNLLEYVVRGRCCCSQLKVLHLAGVPLGMHCYLLTQIMTAGSTIFLRRMYLVDCFLSKAAVAARMARHTMQGPGRHLQHGWATAVAAAPHHTNGWPLTPLVAVAHMQAWTAVHGVARVSVSTPLATAAGAHKLLCVPGTSLSTNVCLMLTFPQLCA